jgi:hypothetical protein
MIDHGYLKQVFCLIFSKNIHRHGQRHFIILILNLDFNQ